MISFSLSLSQFVCVRLAFIALVFSFFVKNVNRSTLFGRAWDIAFYLLVLTIGLSYSEDRILGLSVLETNFSFFALPIIFSKVEDFDKEKLYQIFYTFALGVLVASLMSLINAFLKFSQNHDVHVFFFYQLTDLIDFQPTYFGYYIIFSILFGLYLLYFDEPEIGSRWLLSLSLLFLFLMLMLTGGLTLFMSILFVLSFFLLKFFVEEKSPARKLGFVIAVLMLAGMFLFSSIYKKMDNQYSKITDYWERMALWESAIKANPNVLLGVGTGDYKKELNQFYTSHQMQTYANESYNSHNQFIQILFSNGAIGLLSVLFLLGRPLYLSVINQNVLGALTFFPFLIYGMTEVFLGRFQGVVFFALLHQIFMTFYTNTSSTAKSL